MRALVIGMVALWIAGCAAQSAKVECDSKLSPISAPTGAIGKVVK